MSLQTETGVLSDPIRPRRRGSVKTARKAPARKKTSKREIAAQKTVNPVPEKTKSPAVHGCQIWTAQFIYADAAGEAQVSLMTIEAQSVDAARNFAAAHPPAEEFMVSIHPCSDEQFLGQVRLKALEAAGK
jgi:hypothetical protein